MKKLLLLLLISLVFVSCEKENKKDIGYIYGPDLAMCACCGGNFIKINGDSYRFMEKIDFDIENEVIPLKVRVTWHKKEKQCIGDEIVIETIKIY